MYTYKYPHAALTTDSVVFGFDGRALHILLIERGIEPYKGMWALPGGFMNMDETVEQCAARELREETGVENVYLEQFHVFSGVGRDPRERVVTVAFLALVRKTDFRLIAGDDAARACWFELTSYRRWLSTILRLSRWRESACRKSFRLAQLPSNCSTRNFRWQSCSEYTK